MSGAGLVTLVGWSLYGTARQGRQRAELDARDRARDLTLALRVALRSPELLTVLDDADRFEVQDGRLLVPDTIGWLQQQARPRDDTAVAERQRLAQLAEFTDHDPAGAAAHYDTLLADDGVDADDAQTVRLAAAWQALRAGDGNRVTALLAALDPGLHAFTAADLDAPRRADLIAGRALLAAARPEPLPEPCRRLLPTLPADLLTPALARLHERGVATDALVAEAGARQHHRAVLAVAAAHLPELRVTDTITRAHGGRLLLWYATEHSASDAANIAGSGAWADPRSLLRLLGTRVPDIPGLVFTRPAGDHEVVIPDLAWVEPTPVPPTPWFARPTALLVATLVLLLVFAGSVGFAMRAVRQQAAAMRARSEFLTGVTHELKTPIASIRLVAEVLTDDEVPVEKQRQYFALLAGEAARLSMLIDNVLDLGQIERGERNYDLRAGDFGEVVRRTVALFAPLGERAGMPVTLRGAHDPAPAIVDAGALSQALLAVFENARKYAARGGRLEVDATTDQEHFVITVRDHGPGVPAAERDAIFARFTRGTAQQHGSVPGVGLGLYLARTIVQRHDGTLTCGAPTGGTGCVFTFRLPLLEPTR